MSAGQDFQEAVMPTSNGDRAAKRAPPRNKTTRDCPRVTLRFSLDDYERLKQRADGVALATYIRAKALSDAVPRKGRRSGAAIVDKQALAQILGLLGQSRIANNLNQLAYHANVGSLRMDESTRAQINDAYDHVLAMRKTLIAALGLRE